MKFSHYFLKLTGITVLLTLIILLIQQSSLQTYSLTIHPWMPLIFFTITLTEHRILFATIQKNPKRFSQAFMGASSLKLFLILIVTVIYLLIDKSQVVPFLLVLFVLYVIYTVFEVQALLKLVKHSS